VRTLTFFIPRFGGDLIIRRAALREYRDTAAYGVADEQRVERASHTVDLGQTLPICLLRCELGQKFGERTFEPSVAAR
jgi:hypothetical protein